MSKIHKDSFIEYDKTDNCNLIKSIERICENLKNLIDSIPDVDIECDNKKVKDSIFTAHSWLNLLLSEIDSGKYTMYKECTDDTKSVSTDKTREKIIRDKMSDLLSDSRSRYATTVKIGLTSNEGKDCSINSIEEFNKLRDEFYKNNPDPTYEEYMSWCKDMATKISSGGFAHMILQEALKPKD